MRLKSVPLRSIYFVVGRQEKPGVGPRKVLDGSIDLERSINHWVKPDKLHAYLISPNGSRKDLEALGHNWV